MQSQETRQLAVFIQEEHHEKQNLADLRQKFEQALAQQRGIAEAENEALRIARLQERLETNPLAAKYQIEMVRLEVACALAGNTRASSKMLIEKSSKEGRHRENHSVMYK